MENKKNALILGGTGAMGNFLVEILSSSNEWNVFVTSRSNRKTNLKNVYYVKGNAKELDFMKEICNKKYDAIIDFMNYGLDEFEANYELLLNSTEHYIFLSSCRVYNDDKIITENTSRLLDVTCDQEFLKTQRYALRKAREENILKNCNKNNWTIVRPYITYSPIRLQLGVYEKEEWLYRILNNKNLVIRKEILDKYTTLTYGYDVAQGISNILNNNELYKNAIQIVTNEFITWRDVLNVYLDEIENLLNIRPIIYEKSDLSEIEELFEGGYNTKYDRLWNRKFDNKKANEFCGIIEYKKVEEGLRYCLKEFIKNWKQYGNEMFGNINEEYENKMDYLCAKYEENNKKIIGGGIK